MILPTWKQLRQLIRRGAIFVINHSGGKDSQAMYLRLRRFIPRDQLVIIHADLGEVDWSGCVEHIQATTDGEDFFVVRNKNKTFLEMVEHRGKFPDAQRRQCTSDLKRDPIDMKIRHLLKERGKTLIVNCMGMRAQESPGRSKLQVFKINNRNNKAGREWYDFLPIHKMTKDQVFKTIADNGQLPHWAYEAGMSRLSCSFCIMASKSDLCTAAKLRPELYRKYVETERRLGHTLSMSGTPLDIITGIPVN